LGLGIGLLLRNHQTLAVIMPLAWFSVVEGLVAGLLPKPLAAWTVTEITDAVSYAPDVAGLVAVWVGGLTITGYVVVIVAAGARRFLGGDVAG
jgi:hypothetical protein